MAAQARKELYYFHQIAAPIKELELYRTHLQHTSHSS